MLLKSNLKFYQGQQKLQHWSLAWKYVLVITASRHMNIYCLFIITIALPAPALWRQVFNERFIYAFWVQLNT